VKKLQKGEDQEHAARGIEVAPDDGSVKETYDSKLAKIHNIEQNLQNVETLVKQLRININSM
jgi:hypothetical protein